MHLPFETHLITRVNKREVDQYNCPLIGGGEIGLVKEIQLVGNVRTHVLSPKTGRSTTTRDRWLVASQPQSIVTQKLDEVFVHANRQQKQKFKNSNNKKEQKNNGNKNNGNKSVTAKTKH